jgi:hypothetical protein
MTADWNEYQEEAADPLSLAASGQSSMFRHALPIDTKSAQITANNVS